MRLVQLSDIHFGGENKEAVEAATAWINEARPDLVVVAGDLTLDGKTPEFDAAAAWLKRLPDPMIVVPGNHDTPFVGPRELFERFTRTWRRFKDRFGDEDGAAWRAPGITVTSLNTARAAQVRWNWSKGAVSHGQVRRIVRELKAAPAGDLKVVVCHHPLMEVLGGPMTAKVHGGVSAASHFVEAGADVILSGHIHLPFVTRAVTARPRRSARAPCRTANAAPRRASMSSRSSRAVSASRPWPMSAASSRPGAPGRAIVAASQIRKRRDPKAAPFLCLVSSRSSLTWRAAPSEAVGEQRHHEQDQEDKEQDLGDPDRGPRDAGEAQQGGDQGDH